MNKHTITDAFIFCEEIRTLQMGEDDILLHLDLPQVARFFFAFIVT